jgi:hypothetical protein
VNRAPRMPRNPASSENVRRDSSHGGAQCEVDRLGSVWIQGSGAHQKVLLSHRCNPRVPAGWLVWILHDRSQFTTAERLISEEEARDDWSMLRIFLIAATTGAALLFVLAGWGPG